MSCWNHGTIYIFHTLFNSSGPQLSARINFRNCLLFGLWFCIAGGFSTESWSCSRFLASPLSPSHSFPLEQMVEQTISCEIKSYSKCQKAEALVGQPGNQFQWCRVTGQPANWLVQVFLIPRCWVHETCCIKFPIVVRTDWATSKLISTHLTDNPWINFFINPGGTSVGTPLRQGISIYEDPNIKWSEKLKNW